MSDPAPFIQLPLELTRTIAGLCKLRDLFALGRTCRYLHHICDDVLVLQQSFLSHAEDPTSIGVPDKATLHKLLVARLASEDQSRAKLIWARLALTTSELPELIDELETLLLPDESFSGNRPPFLEPHVALAGDRRVRNIVGVLNTLTVLGCNNPAVNNFTVTAGLTGAAARITMFETPRGSLWSHISMTSEVLFSLAVGCLGHGVLNNMPLNNMSLKHMELLFLRWVDPDAAISTHIYSHFEWSLAAGFTYIACFLCILGSDGRHVVHLDDIPRPDRLPFLNVAGGGVDIPILDGEVLPPNPAQGPITGSDTQTSTLSSTPIGRSLEHFGPSPSWWRWMRNNVDGLIDGLGQGEWHVYLTKALQVRGSGIIPPDRNNNIIRFSVEQDQDDADRVLLIGKGGVDGIFRWTGELSRSTGMVILRNHADYSDQWRHYIGTLTPLGIGGYWADSAVCPMGFLWMYRKEWTAAGAED